MTQIHSLYKPLYTSSKRYFLVTGGRGSLKSTTVHDLVSRLTYQPNQGILFTRYTMASAKLSIIPEFEESLRRNGSYNDFHITSNKITNKHTGSFVIFSGIKTSSGDQTANLKSLAGVTTWVIEEGEDFLDEKAFDRIDDSIRSTVNQNRIIWIQNPSTREHFIYKRWIEPRNKSISVHGYDVTVSDHEDVEHIHSTYHIADGLGYLSQSFIDKANKSEKDNPKWYYHNYIGGWLEKAEGVIFENWKEGTFDEALPEVYGMDFGYSNDPTTLVKVAIDNKSMKLYASTLLYQTGLTTTGIAEHLKDLVNPNDLIIADNAEPRLIAELVELGYNVRPCVKGPDSIRKGIKDLQSYEIIVDPLDSHLKKELNNYIWNSKKAGVPIDDYNHIIDPLRYVLQDHSETPEFFFS